MDKTGREKLETVLKDSVGKDVEILPNAKELGERNVSHVGIVSSRPPNYTLSALFEANLLNYVEDLSGDIPGKPYGKEGEHLNDPHLHYLGATATAIPVEGVRFHMSFEDVMKTTS